MLHSLPQHQALFVKQAFELAEIFGFETRNKYRICDERGHDIAFAAEQQKGFLGFLFRQVLGHWRSFDVHFFTASREPFLVAHHPFRWFFQRLEVREEASGRALGAIERRFSILGKRFELQDSTGRVFLSVNSPIWKLWTFPFLAGGRERARVLKKWGGIGYELFTDKDTFRVEYLDPALTADERALILVATVYVDLLFFEGKGNGGGVGVLDFAD